MGQRVLILSAGIGSGHNSAAAVLEASLRANPEVAQVRRVDVLETASDLYRTVYDDGYFAMVESVPWLVGWGYDKGDVPFRLGNSLPLWDRFNTHITVKTIKNYRPDVIICTHFIPTRLVSLLLNRGTLKVPLSVVTTDYDFQGLWLSSPFTTFFVARAETKAHMVDIGLPRDRLTVSGIPVEPELGNSVDREQILTRFGLRPDLPTVLISAGAAGGPYTTAIVRQSLRMRNRFQAVVVCGHNEQLKGEIENLVRGRGAQYRVLGFTSEMADLMRASTLFVGKPGGLSSSECMAAGLPMILIKPIPGQEVRNSDFLLEEGAAVRCNYDTTVGFKIDNLLDNPERVTEMAANARRLGRPDAGAQIASTAMAPPPPPLWISHDAQRSILAASEQGVGSGDLDAERRLHTLVDAESGLSAGVITGEQLDTLLLRISTGSPTEPTFTVSARRLRSLRRRLTEPGLLLTLRRILGPATERRLRILN
jgi:processive 1,2-diacylglycerol beta-glucosyltransferase